MRIKEFIKGFQKGFRQFGHNIATIVNSILLLMVYIIGVGVTSVIAKAIGKHFLDLKISKKQETYWTELDLNKKPTEEYYRQF